MFKIRKIIYKLLQFNKIVIRNNEIQKKCSKTWGKFFFKEFKYFASMLFISVEEIDRNKLNYNQVSVS